MLLSDHDQAHLFVVFSSRRIDPARHGGNKGASSKTFVRSRPEVDLTPQVDASSHKISNLQQTSRAGAPAKVRQTITNDEADLSGNFHFRRDDFARIRQRVSRALPFTLPRQKIEAGGRPRQILLRADPAPHESVQPAAQTLKP
jgi:hypothetical protein